MVKPQIPPGILLYGASCLHHNLKFFQRAMPHNGGSIPPFTIRKP